MDPFYVAILRYRQRQFDECINLCTDVLRKNPLDQVKIAFSILLILIVY